MVIDRLYLHENTSLFLIYVFLIGYGSGEYMLHYFFFLKGQE